ncbi:FlgL Flagellin and related hook-associated proteins [Oxalobacteraceae bacterium]
MLSLNTNINAMVAANAYSSATAAYSQASTRISTQLAINSAKDNPVGLAVANRWKAQIASYAKATDNINAGISAVQIADSALSEIATVLTSMKTLATSSASGTASAATRASNQTVFETYMAQIDSIAESAEYNGASLLNGDTPSIKVQTGINSGDTTTLNFSSVISSALGTGSPLALTSLGESTSALASGDLLINGYTIGASLASYDSYSYASNSGSAIAKAAAINLMTSSTNVEADVGTTTVAGSAMTAAGTGTAGTITINGTAISLTLAASNDYATNRAAVVTAINLNSGQTGVSATDTNSSTLGVTLTATDGRNITVAFDGTNLTAARTGIGAAGTYAGTYTLRSLDQTDITISSNVGGTIANAGLDIGTYDSNTAQVSTKKRSASTSAPTAMSAGDLTINGYAIGATLTSDDTASSTTATSSTKAASAIAMAAAINRQTTLTGVTASANPNVVVGTGFSAAAVSTIYLNGQTITAGLTASSSIDNVVTLLNNYTGSTGVTASNNGSGVTLTASDGRNISIATNTGAGAAIGISGMSGSATSAAGAETYIATVKLYSEATFAVSAGTEGYSDFTTLGFVAGTYGGSSDDTRVSELDISTQTGGSNAMSVLDDAIDMVSSYQALVGAQENILGYQSDYVAATNVAATTAYGNIMDYDLAAETTALASAQIKQNGAMAMLAQANISQDMVAYLLKQFIS